VGQLTVDGSSIFGDDSQSNDIRLRRRHRFSRWRRPGRRELHHQDQAGPGISFKPSLPNSRLEVIDTIFRGNGNGSNGGGIIVQPQGSGGAKVTLDRVQVNANVTGIFITAAVNQAVRVAIEDSTVSANSFTGIYVLSTGGVVTAGIKKSKIANNGGIGVYAQARTRSSPSQVRRLRATAPVGLSSAAAT